MPQSLCRKSHLGKSNIYPVIKGIPHDHGTELRAELLFHLVAQDPRNIESLATIIARVLIIYSWSYMPFILSSQFGLRKWLCAG